MKKVMLISGSSRGIGRATAVLAAENDYKVVVHGNKKTSELMEFSKSIDAKCVFFDITDEKSVNRSVTEIINELGHIDVLVNSAGIVIPSSVLESDFENWIEHYKVNVLGIVNLVKSIAPHMKKRGAGSIVNIASVRGHSSMASSRVAAYSASKAAVINLTASLAKELAPAIRVNAVSPSFTMTDMSKTWSKEVWQQAQSNLLGRAAEPIEIAESVIFLAGSKASHITGQTITVDGGYSISNK